MADGTLNFDTKVDASGFSGAVGKLGGIAGKAMAGVTAAVGAGTAAFAGLTKSALDNVASYEQLAGGVETLFGAGGATIEEYAASVGKSVGEVDGEFSTLETAQQTVLDNANKAYQTAGMSANQYMETVTSFAASLKQSTSDEIEAANAADQAVQDMADNANKMGSSMESIQNAYQGFAKQNYTMLDNLKLGYGGTKSEMERLLADAEKIHQETTGEVTHYDINNLADVYAAIHDVQDSLGITGTTAKEASTTIEGSMSAAKAAWDNFLTGTGDVDQLAESVATLANNVVNNLSEIVPRLASGLPTLVSQLGGMIPGLFNQILPSLIEGAVTLINGLVSVLPELVRGLLPPLLQGAASVISALVSELPALLTTIASVGLDLMDQLATGVMSFDFAGLADKIVNGITGFIEGGGFEKFCEAAVNIISGLATGIGQMLPKLIPALIELAIYIGKTLIQQAPQLILAAGQLIIGLAQGIINALPVVWNALCELFTYLGQLGSQVWAWISTNVGGWIDGIAAWFGQLPSRIWTWLASVVTKLGEWGASVITWITTTIPTWINSIGEWFAQLPERIAYALGYAIGSIIQWGINVVNWIATNVPIWIENITTFFSQLPGKIWTWLVNTANKLNQWRQELVSKGTAAASGLFNAVVDGIKGLPDKMLSIGEDIVTGIWNGISSGWDWLTGKVKDLANSLLQGAKDALGIGSPSKAFRDEFGAWLLPGAEIGIEKTMPSALKTMRESATSLLEEMQGTVADYSGEIALSAGSSASGKAMTGGGTTVYNDNSVEQTNTYNVPTATPSEVAKAQREAVRNIVGGVK